MRPTSPAPDCNARSLDGFTLVETLVALVILTILSMTTCSALLTALRAERAARTLHESVFLKQAIVCAAYLGASPSNLTQSTSRTWTLDSQVFNQASEETNVRWTVWQLTPQAEAGSGGRIYLRSKESE